jgi:hypothetical protein
MFAKHRALGTIVVPDEEFGAEGAAGTEAGATAAASSAPAADAAAAEGATAAAAAAAGTGADSNNSTLNDPLNDSMSSTLNERRKKKPLSLALAAGGIPVAGEADAENYFVAPPTNGRNRDLTARMLANGTMTPRTAAIRLPMGSPGRRPVGGILPSPAKLQFPAQRALDAAMERQLASHLQKDKWVAL